MPQRGTERFDAVDWNYWRATAAFCATARDGDVRETRRFLLADVGVPAGAFNLALVARPEADLETALDAATAFFGDKQHPFRVSFRAEHVPACEPLLKDRGFTRADDIPGMLLARPPVTLPEADGVRFRRVEDAATLADFQRTAFLGFGLPEQAAHLFLSEDLLRVPAFEAIVGYVDEEAACTSAVYETAGVAGIYWVATLERHRNKGLGAAATWAAVASGRRRGHAVASLQASAMGRPVYARMGFDHDRSYARFEAPAEAG